MSSTYIAVSVSFLTLALPILGIEVIDQKSIVKTISDLVGVGALLYAFYGRYRAGGITAFGLRKKEVE